MLFRRVCSRDKARIIEISSTIWEGHDYIPNIIDQWIADDRGEFTMIIDEDQIVGFGKLTFTNPGIGWLEGLRVAPEVRSKGYAKELTRYYIEKGQKLGFKKLRLSTYYENYASIHIIEKFGFHKIADFFQAEREVDQNKRVETDVLQARYNSSDYQDLQRLFLNSPAQQVVKNQLGFGWLFKELNEDELLKAIKRGDIYYLKDSDQVTGAIWVYPDQIKDNAYYIVMASGSDEAINTLLTWTHQDAHRRGFDLMAAMIPEEKWMKSIFRNQGFKHWEDRQEENVFIYEYQLEGGDD